MKFLIVVSAALTLLSLPCSTEAYCWEDGVCTLDKHEVNLLNNLPPELIGEILTKIVVDRIALPENVDLILKYGTGEFYFYQIKDQIFLIPIYRRRVLISL